MRAFTGPNTVRVGDRELEARHIVIATGSKPRPLPIPGAELMITSDEMLSERELPASVIFVGGGVIALEFGHVYARAGIGGHDSRSAAAAIAGHGRRCGRAPAGRERADRHPGQDRRQRQAN